MSNTNKFRSLRLARAWSQEQLAELSGLSVRTVQRIENGDQPSLETLSALAAVFEVSVADLSGPDAPVDDALDQRIAEAKSYLAEEGRFYRSVITAIVVCALLLVLNHFTAPTSVWSLWLAGIWFALLFIRGMRMFVFRGLISRWQQKRLQQILRR
ncbi:helix-turn-helix domain-containing protein [Citrobacter farmeri]|uniref:helix-turn-helix domain-containing protein n=1 Tax=Citrobacter farmeri TaxID=67824 RepID=UPI001903945D|nr:helix-turn-helix domain-containing protein [Citrobacter farmeri]EKV7297780.1 helix-turn-helix domain-containing protein [Citrobacter farmeri]MBJ8747468.1 helix-turn-helix domain-containing protein [Citrobacter farmeri]MBJ8761626.1 helix-turn-helix domain-containing protein [Citrobacter farmeri]MBJ9018040.1 helix-turn-helix domain-containing protein [Citrobacter farmeri]